MAEEKTRKEAENTAEAPETKKVSDEQIADEKVQQEEAKSDKKKKGKKDKKEEKIEELEEQLHQIQDKHLRLQAEFDNFRRRTMKPGRIWRSNHITTTPMRQRNTGN